MADKQQILNYLASNKERFCKEYHLKRIGIFGSLARGEQTQNSDIDLIVEFEEGTEDLSGIKQRLKNEIQSIFKTPVDICREKYIISFFRSQIQQEAEYV
jgi:uncharacterized protein